MILLDFSQLATAGYMVNIHGKVDGDLDVFRYAVTNSVRLVNSKYRKQYGKLYLAVDNSTSWRKQFFPYYKAARKTSQNKSTIDWAQLKKFVRTVQSEYKEYLPWSVIDVDGAEGDDVIGTLAREATEPTLIISADKDFVQLHTNPNIKQWDAIHQRWIGVPEPNRHLFEHVVRGDVVDGVPNIFSADDHYVSKSQRAKRIMKADVENWWTNGLGELKDLPGLKRNINLIDLKRTPQPIQSKIKQIAEQPTTSGGRIVNYLIKHRLAALSKHIGDF